MLLHGAECPKRTVVWSNHADIIQKLVGALILELLLQLSL